MQGITYAVESKNGPSYQCYMGLNSLAILMSFESKHIYNWIGLNVWHLIEY